MEKNIMEKVNEVLKAHGRRELSLDEQDKVVGGSVEKGPTPRTVYLNGQLIDEVGFNAIFINMTKTAGLDVAIKALYNMTGFSCTAMRETGTTNPLDAMDVILNQFWLAIDEI